jgi:coenzyme F420-0:L-glutamate ligase
MKVSAIKTRLFKEREALERFIAQHIPKLKNGSILAVTSKIIALSEGRTANGKDEAKLIRIESDWVMPTRYGSLTLKDGLLMWNAGIDESNAKGKIVLLPKDSFTAATKLRSALKKYYHIKKLGIVITDSRIMPLRAGVVGVALGYAGFKGLRDYRGKKDLFGRKLKFTQTDVADSLATAATLAMGEGSERRPLAIITDAPVAFSGKINKNELRISLEDDMYRPLFKTTKRKKK